MDSTGLVVPRRSSHSSGIMATVISFDRKVPTIAEFIATMTLFNPKSTEIAKFLVTHYSFL